MTQLDHYETIPEDQRIVNIVRPYRDSYKHLPCTKITRMSRDIAETFSTDPTFYTHTYCCYCGDHFPVSQFVWLDDNNDPVGS
jgi:hypothetical protein